MSIYKIFPIADTTLYSESNTANSGLDAVLYLSKGPSSAFPSQSTYTRPLIQFSTDDMNEVVSNYIGTSSYQSYLKMYLVDAIGIPTNLTLEAHPVYQNWDMGIGKLYDIPINNTGASWAFPTANSSSYWLTSVFPSGVTASFESTNSGGGTWYTSSYSQSFQTFTDLDAEIEVTSFIQSFVSGLIPNHGFIVKTSGSLEFDPNYNYTLNYFSRDSNTIYPPVLEFRWDDSYYTPTTNICQNGKISVSLQNNCSTYREGSTHQFRISARDQYPARQFVTGSMFTSNKFLPSSSYWSLIDYKTQDVVIGFDDTYTKISADATSNLFTMYMSGLEPLRYYKLLIKSVIGGETIIFDNDYIFQVE